MAAARTYSAGVVFALALFLRVENGFTCISINFHMSSISSAPKSLVSYRLHAIYVK